MNVLIDTFVWIDHFRHNNAALVDLLLADSALTHPMVILEIACGTLKSRVHTLSTLDLLQTSNQASLGETMGFIEREKLYGLGCGLVDMILLASTLMTPGAKLWTLDKRLAGLAQRFNLAYCPRC